MQLPEAPVYVTSDERRDGAVLGALSGAAAVVPLLLLTVGLWVSPPHWSAAWIAWIVDWGGANLAFLAGVRRGLGFSSPGGERATQIVAAAWLFVLAALALVSPAAAWRVGFLLAGYASQAAVNLLAPRQPAAPHFFARLRPLQTIGPIACLAATELWLLHH